MDNSSFGNPENPLRWTTKSLRNLSDELRTQGISIGHVTVGKIPGEMGSSLQVNRIRNRWHLVGAETFSGAAVLYITADGGSSNGTRCRVRQNMIAAHAEIAARCIKEAFWRKILTGMHSI